MVPGEHTVCAQLKSRCMTPGSMEQMSTSWQELELLGLDDHEVEWFKSYLSGRSQFALTTGASSGL